jgi:hypothetical protein
MSFALRAWFGNLCRLKIKNKRSAEQTFGVYSKLSNTLVGNIVLRDRPGNSDWLATELHRQVFLCLKQASVQVERLLPSKFLTVFVGQVELQVCEAISFALLAQQRISFMWDYALHERLNFLCFGNHRGCGQHLVASFPNGLPRDFTSVAQHVIFLELKNLRLASSTFVGAHKLACLQKLYITDAWVDGRAEVFPLSAQLPRNLTELVVTLAHQRGQSQIDLESINRNRKVLFEGIHKFASLKVLRLSAKLDYISDKIGQMTNLVVLDLSFNKLCSLPSLKRLVNLEELALSSNKLCSLPSLKRLVNLEALDLANNPYLGGRLDLPCAKLALLDISFCDFGQDVLDDLRTCSTLRLVRLKGNSSLHGTHLTPLGDAQDTQT